jgi:hypothetical protein
VGNIEATHVLLVSDRIISYYEATDMPYGKSYGQWTVKWWQWVLGIPRSINPVMDTTGEYAGIFDQDENVAFLAGKLAEEKGSLPVRHCDIPFKKSILIPVINCESNSLECPELENAEDIVKRVRSDENTIVSPECYVDGIKVPTQRIQSDPVIFDVKMVEDNLFGVKGGGFTSASADGYWAFLKPLHRGEHTITFQGSCENGRLHSGAIYQIYSQ